MLRKYGGVRVSLPYIQAVTGDLTCWKIKFEKLCPRCFHKGDTFHYGIPYGVNIVVGCNICLDLTTRFTLDRFLIKEYLEDYYLYNKPPPNINQYITHLMDKMKEIEYVKS